MNNWNNINDFLPPFKKIVELECNGNIFKASLFDYLRPEGIVRWLCDNPNKIEFSTAEKWRFINE